MKPDVKKIIADIKATKGNRKYCNGLAGTLQDDNYVSSICKYVKTVTPERIDLLIDYVENLEVKVLDTAEQLANAESKCRELAAENANARNAVQTFCDVVGANTDAICEEVGQDGVRAILAAMNATGNMPATDAFLAEVRAQGVEMFAIEWGGHDSPYGQDAYNFADKIRQEAAQ
ncbi:hypothetical protein N5C51_20660 [Citrobacter freundii]|uniref:hypothetical protein n=1 Tax=Citrobacter freundii TaxID=546 RepID=UPI000A933E50|nr:hypothetical protein [Citrobacter freundii]MDH0770377.1 hypothetical protein [Citrobacter freundii]MDH1811191.1 hypothetical protein [Citrobacter freundii]MDH1963689.1 hypothetical protein [Citrobacter freundii]